MEEEKKRAKALNARLKAQQEENSDMPQVMDYVSQRAEMYELENAIKNWVRKVEIAKLANKRRRRGGRRAAAH